MNLRDILIDIAEIRDINELIELNKEEYWEKEDLPKSSELFELGKWWVIPELLKWHKQIINNCTGEILIARYNKEIIAELDYVVSPDCTSHKIKRIHIIWLLVKRNYRNKGIAKLLINHLKINFHNIEIWVEAEDKRSLSLYSSIGKKRRNITNWKLSSKSFNKKNIINQDIKIVRTISYDDLMLDVKYMKLYPIIGRYYAPIFDLEQLRSSDEVYPYIWGNTDKSIIQVYQYNSLKIFVILTQYLRIYIKDPYFSRIEFQHLLSIVMIDIFKHGYDEIYAQTYSEDNINGSLKKIGFILDDDSDYVFMM